MDQVPLINGANKVSIHVFKWELNYVLILNVQCKHPTALNQKAFYFSKQNEHPSHKQKFILFFILHIKPNDEFVNPKKGNLMNNQLQRQAT